MKKTISLLLALLLLVGMLSGCGSSSSSTTTETTSSTDAEATVSDSAAAAESEPSDESAEAPAEAVAEAAEMPLANHDVTLTMWYEWPPYLTDGSGYETPNDFPFFQNLSDVTGVDFDFTVVSMIASDEQFNLMVASQSYTDVLCAPGKYTGSLDSAIENDVFLDLTDLVEEYAPNYLAQVSREDVRRDVYSQDGRLAVFYEIAKEEYPANQGMVIRQDWLDKLGLSTPKTYDELHDVLLAFKTELGVESPIFIDGTSLFLDLTAGYEFQDDFTNRDGEAVYSASSENFKTYLTMMHQWYEEGLIYQDYYTLADNDVEKDAVKTRLIDSDQVGVWDNWCEDLQLYESNDPDYDLSAINNPVVNAGEVTHLSMGIDPIVNTSGGWAISTNCPDDKVVIAVKLIDYLYSEEGSILANWGIENETFYYDENGTPRYTDVVLNNPDFATNMCIGLYCVFRGPILSDLSRFNQNVVGELAEYCDVWGVQDNSYDMPEVSMDAKDSERYSFLYNDIDTTISENVPKFIIGDRPIDEVDDFIETLYAMGLQEMVDLEQAALDAYYTK